MAVRPIFVKVKTWAAWQALYVEVSGRRGVGGYPPVVRPGCCSVGLRRDGLAAAASRRDFWTWHVWQTPAWLLGWLLPPWERGMTWSSSVLTRVQPGYWR